MNQDENINIDASEQTQSAKPDYASEIIGIIRSDKSPKLMQTLLEDYHENDISEVISLITPAERAKLFHILSVSMLSEILEYSGEEEAAEYLSEMDMKKAVSVVSDMDSDNAVVILKKIPKEKRVQIIDLMDDEARDDVTLIASFDDDEIGSKMTTNYIAIKQNLSVKQAMRSLIRQASDNDNITTLFVVDDKNEFYGALDLKDLIIAREGTDLEKFTVTSFPYVYGSESVDDCIEKLKNYSEDSIPVLDNYNRLIGVITSQSLIEVVDKEMGEDYAKLAGLTAEEDLKEPLVESMKKRMPWLLILLALGMIVSGVVGAFEKVVSQLTLIMAFQSLILDMAGNVGTQSLAVTIRVLMDENLTGSQKLRLVTKEMKVGISNGLILGVISFLFVGLYIMLFKNKELLFSFAVSGCIGISLLIAMLISSTVGTLIPLFFKKIKVDPAVASGPLITTINDLVAVVTYYGISWLLLLNIMNLS